MYKVSDLPEETGGNMDIEKAIHDAAVIVSYPDISPLIAEKQEIREKCNVKLKRTNSVMISSVIVLFVFVVLFACIGKLWAAGVLVAAVIAAGIIRGIVADSIQKQKQAAIAELITVESYKQKYDDDCKRLFALCEKNGITEYSPENERDFMLVARQLNITELTDARIAFERGKAFEILKITKERLDKARAEINQLNALADEYLETARRRSALVGMAKYEEAGKAQYKYASVEEKVQHAVDLVKMRDIIVDEDDRYFDSVIILADAAEITSAGTMRISVRTELAGDPPMLIGKPALIDGSFNLYVRSGDGRRIGGTIVCAADFTSFVCEKMGYDGAEIIALCRPYAGESFSAEEKYSLESESIHTGAIKKW